MSLTKIIQLTSIAQRNNFSPTHLYSYLGDATLLVCIHLSEARWSAGRYVPNRKQSSVDVLQGMLVPVLFCVS